MTVEDVVLVLSNMATARVRREITQDEYVKQRENFLSLALRDMTDEQKEAVVQGCLYVHQLIADSIRADGGEVPGNDSNKSN